jgi:hypothetical protein
MTQILQLMLMDDNGSPVAGVTPFIFGLTETVHALPFTDEDLRDVLTADWDY